jgi:hypothetical protein
VNQLRAEAFNPPMSQELTLSWSPGPAEPLPALLARIAPLSPTLPPELIALLRMLDQPGPTESRRG